MLLSGCHPWHEKKVTSLYACGVHYVMRVRIVWVDVVVRIAVCTRRGYVSEIIICNTG